MHTILNKIKKCSIYILIALSCKTSTIVAEESRLKFSMDFVEKQHIVNGSMIPGDLYYVLDFDPPKLKKSGEKFYRGKILQIFRLEQNSSLISEHTADATLITRVNEPDCLEITWNPGEVEHADLETLDLDRKKGLYKVISHTDVSQVGNNKVFLLTSLDALPYWAKTRASRFARSESREQPNGSAANFTESAQFKKASSAARAAYWEGRRDALNEINNSTKKPSGEIRMFYDLGHSRGWFDRLPIMQLEALQRAFDDIE